MLCYKTRKKKRQADLANKHAERCKCPTEGNNGKLKSCALSQNIIWKRS